MTSPKPADELVILIHGTFAYDERDTAIGEDRSRWWQRGSDFAKALQKNLPHCEIVPSGHRVSHACRPWWWFWNSSRKPLHNPPESAFHWSGENLETIRRAAGRRLLNHLDDLLSYPPTNRKFHLVAHSHGGGVVWEALCLAYERNKKGQDRNKLLERLQTWTTVATPFLHFQADWYRLLVNIFCFVSFLLVALHQRAWWTDFWRLTQWTNEANWQGTIYPYILLIHAAALCLVLFPLYALWCLFRFLDSGGGPSDEREQTCYDFASAAVGTFWALIVFTVIFGALVVFSNATLRYAWPEAFKWNCVLSSVWTLLVFTGLSYTLVCSFQVICRSQVERSRRICSCNAWKFLKNRHRALPVGYERYDEALIGLRSVVEVPNDRILPRIPAPGSKRFTRRGNIRQPEFESERATFRQWMIDFGFLPIAIVRDWLLRPFYNDVFAVLVDQFVLHRLWKSAHGTDLSGAKIKAVTPLPVLPGVSLNEVLNPNPPSDSLRETKKRVERALSSYISSLRRHLGLNVSAAIKVLDLLKDAVRDPARKADLLFHTSYFKVEGVPRNLSDEMAEHITHPESKTPVPIIPRTLMRRPRPECYNVQYEFFATLGRLIVVLAILLAPATALGFAGAMLFYGSSRNYAQAWAYGPIPEQIASEFYKDLAAPIDQLSGRRSFVRYVALRSRESPEILRLLRFTKSKGGGLQLAAVECALCLARDNRVGQSVDVLKNIAADAAQLSDSNVADLQSEFFAASIIIASEHPDSAPVLAQIGNPFSKLTEKGSEEKDLQLKLASMCHVTQKEEERSQVVDAILQGRWKNVAEKIQEAQDTTNRFRKLEILETADDIMAERE